MQVEYVPDIFFYKQKYLQAMYDTLTRTAIHTVKPQNIATFLGKKFMAIIKVKGVITLTPALRVPELSIAWVPQP